MSDDDKELWRIAESELLRVNALALGAVAGLVSGAGLFLATNWLLLKGGPEPGPHLALLGQYFWGFRVSFLGSLVGFAWAFFCGFAAAYAGARIYNAVAGWRAARTRPNGP